MGTSSAVSKAGNYFKPKTIDRQAPKHGQPFVIVMARLVPAIHVYYIS